nr:MAG TPA: hypothetical protein [Caudoviricetes sp.]
MSSFGQKRRRGKVVPPPVGHWMSCCRRPCWLSFVMAPRRESFSVACFRLTCSSRPGSSASIVRLATSRYLSMMRLSRALRGDSSPSGASPCTRRAWS